MNTSRMMALRLGRYMCPSNAGKLTMTISLRLHYLIISNIINPLIAKLFNLNFHPLEVMSRCRDQQLQVSENYSDLTKWRSTVFKYC